MPSARELTEAEQLNRERIEQYSRWQPWPAPEPDNVPLFDPDEDDCVDDDPDYEDEFLESPTRRLNCRGCGRFISEEQVTVRTPVPSRGTEYLYCRSCTNECIVCHNQYRPREPMDVGLPGVCTRDECRVQAISCSQCGHVTTATLGTNIYATRSTRASDVNARQRSHGICIVCEHCATTRFVYCDIHDIYEDRTTRRNCLDNLVGNYNSNPKLKFHSFGPFGERIKEAPTDGQIYMGMELETECVDIGTMRDNNYYEGAKLLLKSHKQHLWLKRDGSLHDGIEICTHPMTLEYFRSINWDVFEALFDYKFQAWNQTRCGMHIHVGRSAFKNDSHLWKFCQMIVANPEKSQKFAGRPANSYCVMDGMKKKASRHVAKKPVESPHHYDAVNLSNPNTVEVRIFRSTLKIRRILANWEFLDAVVRYTEKITIPQIRSEDALKWKVFRKWLEGQSQYEELLSFVDNGKED